MSRRYFPLVISAMQPEWPEHKDIGLFAGYCRRLSGRVGADGGARCANVAAVKAETQMGSDFQRLVVFA